MTVVQRSPNLGLTLRMQRIPTAGPAASDSPTIPGEGELFGVGWLGGILDAGTNIASELLPDGRWDIHDIDRWRLESSIWVGTPVVVDSDFVAQPVPGPGFHCVELQVETTCQQTPRSSTWCAELPMPERLDLEIQLPPMLSLRLLKPPATLHADMASVIVGKPGPPGGMTYTHTQAIAAAVWTVAHNLGRRPSVAVTDHLGNQIWPDVRWVDDNLVQVTHGTPLTGFAYCN